MANHPLNPNSMPERNVTLSIVSHGQNALVNQLLGDVQRVCAGRVALVLTQNVPDPCDATRRGAGSGRGE